VSVIKKYIKKIAFVILFLIFLFPRISSSQIESVPAKKSPLIFIGQDIDSIDSYIIDIGHVPDGLMSYTSIQRLEGLDSAFDSGGGTQYAQGLIEEYLGVPLQIGLYLVGALDDILAGQYDKSILKLADWFNKNKNTTIYLRIGYEFDNPENNYEFVAYIQAYRYIVDHLRKLGVRNALYVWHSYGAFVIGDIERWYPGDSYVDWVAISFYDAFGKSNMMRTFNIAKKYNKPVMIAESTPRGMNVEDGKKVWNLWHKQLFDFAEKNDVKIICYINWDWEDVPMFQGQGWGNGRIQDNDFIRNKWLDEVLKD